jgi:thioredoxin 1
MAGGNIVKLSRENWESEVVNSTVPVLVDFYADWCGPCKMLVPVLEDLSTEYAGRFKIGKVDSDVEQELAAAHRVSSIPALFFYKQGQVVEQMLGAKSKRDLKAAFDRLLA